MINYRVQNIEGLVNKLKANGVYIVDEISHLRYSKCILRRSKAFLRDDNLLLIFQILTGKKFIV